VHRARVAENDVLAQIIALKDDASRISEPLGDDAAPLGIDADHAPTVSVADLINTITATVPDAGTDGQASIIVATEHPTRTCCSRDTDALAVSGLVT
jgi:hypothetical protein